MEAQTETVAPDATQVAPEAVDLTDVELYQNRELSWLDFNERVLELTEEERVPLLEQVKFLAIYSSNLDEFYMVRVAGLHDQVDAGIDARGPDGLAPAETIERIAARAAREREASALLRRPIRGVEPLRTRDASGLGGG